MSTEIFCSAATTLVPNGTQAQVANISLAPFLGWQHPHLTTLALSRVAFLALVAAFDKGWIDPQGKFFSIAKYELKPLVTDAQESLPPQDAFSTVFVVSMEIQSSCLQEVEDLRTKSATVVMCVSAVGTSSFSIFLKVLLSDPDETLLGTVQLSFVHIDFATRRPAALPVAKKALLQTALQSEDCLSQFGVSKMVRLPVKECLSAHSSSPFLYRRTFSLRPSDFDFNLHLNQSMYQSFAVDAVKDAILEWLQAAALPQFLQKFFRIADCCSGEVNDEGLQRCALKLDAYNRRLRIDYLKEIRLPSKSSAAGYVVHVDVSPCEHSSADALHCFFTLTLNDDARDSVLRAVGVLEFL